MMSEATTNEADRFDLAGTAIDFPGRFVVSRGERSVTRR
jgi:hypothetical protein